MYEPRHKQLQGAQSPPFYNSGGNTELVLISYRILHTHWQGKKGFASACMASVLFLFLAHSHGNKISSLFPQIRCFDAPLQPNALSDVKNIVRKNTEAGVERDGITLEGLPLLSERIPLESSASSFRDRNPCVVFRTMGFYGVS